jgi:benzoate membrane transport protein
VAAISAAVCMTDDAEPRAERRYLVTLWAGGFYLLAGLFAATVVALLAALPQSLVLAITGVALLATLSNSLTVAVSQDAERDAAIVTFRAPPQACRCLAWGARSGAWSWALRCCNGGGVTGCARAKREHDPPRGR